MILFNSRSPETLKRRERERFIIREEDEKISRSRLIFTLYKYISAARGIY